MSIRPATLADSPALTRLSAELGYPTTDAVMHGRLEQLLHAPGQAVLVVTVDDQPAGYCHVAICSGLLDERRVEILALVIAAARRGQGLGRRLVAAATDWARVQGCVRLVVRSNIRRDDAHAFYERLGFERVKSQHVFVATL